MRKAERVIRKNKQKLSEQYRKIDTTVNGDAEMLVEKHREFEKKLYPLRIDKRTVIYVTKDKLTPEYVEMSRKKLLHQEDDLKQRRGGNSTISLDVDELKRMVDDRMTIKDIARNMGVSGTTVSNYIKTYDLRNGKQ